MTGTTTTPGDERYTAEAIRAMTSIQLEQHLANRLEQRLEAERLEAESRNALVNSPTREAGEEHEWKLIRALREISEQRAILIRLNQERLRRETDVELDAGASTGIPSEVCDWMEARLADSGLAGFSLEDDDTREVTRIIWQHAYLGLEGTSDRPFDNRAVATRVTNAWMALYEPLADDEPGPAR